MGGKGLRRELKTLLSLHLQFALLVEISKAKIIENQWPVGFGAHPSTFGNNMLPSLGFPWVHSKTGQIPLSVHRPRLGEGVGGGGLAGV